MTKHLTDLGLAAAAHDALHQPGEAFGLRNPARRAAFGQTAVINQLNAEPADRSDLAEHVRLKLAGRIPRGLSARCRVEGED
jgi:hypothetical protein